MVNAEHGPLNILIAGAGIGGLSAALALRQAGHNVQVFERSSFNNEYGAAVSIGPNANGLLRNMGLALEDFGGVDTKIISEFTGVGQLVRSMDTTGIAETFKHPWQFIHRADLHNGLKKVVTATSGKGKPVTINLNSKVVSVDLETATLTLENGKIYHGDVVIGADGVHSVLRRQIDPSAAAPESFGLAGYRFLIPTSILLADPQTERFVKNLGEFQFWSTGLRRFIAYSCRDGELLNCGLVVSDEISEQKKEWPEAVLKADMLEQFKEFHPDTLALMSKACNIKYWPLFDLPSLKSWVNGRAALIGDAAHPFLPFQGQGAAQAVEDAVTLAEMLPINQTAPEDIPERLRLYQLARRERVGVIQQASRQNGLGPDSDINKNSPLVNMVSYNFSHDAREHAAELLRKSLEEGSNTASL